LIVAATLTEPKLPRLARLCARISADRSAGTEMKCQLPPDPFHSVKADFTTIKDRFPLRVI